MNILITTGWPLDAKNGVTSTIRKLINTAPYQNHEVFVLTPSSDPMIWVLSQGSKELERIKLVFFNNRYIGLVDFFDRLRYQPANIIRLIKLLKKYNINILHHHFLGHHGYLFFPACRLLGIPMTLSLHGSDIYRPIDSWIYSLSRFFLHRADGIFSCSDHLKKAAIESYGPWRDRLTTIYHGVDIAVSTHPVPQKQNLIVTVGRLDPIKGGDVLIEAARIIRIQCPDLSFRVHIIGGGDYTSELSALIRQFGLEDTVYLLGEFDSAQVIEALSEATLYVQPSRQESLSISILEAMACRKAVIATRVGGVSEIIEDGNSGLLVEKEDATGLAEKIIELLANEALRAHYAQAGFEKIQKKFHWPDNAGKYISIYERLCLQA